MCSSKVELLRMKSDSYGRPDQSLSTDSLQAAVVNIHITKNVLAGTVRELVERGSKLGKLSEKAAELSQQAGKFSVAARRTGFCTFWRVVASLGSLTLTALIVHSLLNPD